MARNRRLGKEKSGGPDLAVIDDPLCGDRFVLLVCIVLGILVLGVLGQLGPPSGLTWAVGATVLGVAVFCAAAVQEALRVPCIATHATPAQMVRTILRMLGDLVLTPVYACRPEEKPVLGYQRTPENVDIVAQCPSLLGFRQTPWLQNFYWASSASMVGDMAGVFSQKSVRREILRTPDGGFVALDWWEEGGVGSSGAKFKGVLFVGSTVIADAVGCANVRSVCRLFSSHNWRCVVFVKRGCGMVMPNRQPAAAGAGDAKPWNLSGLWDTVLAIDHVASKHPGLPICGVGFSLGGAQIRHYVNSLGEASKLCVAVLVDAASDWDRALLSCDERCPLISKGIGAALALTFRRCGWGTPAKPLGGCESEEVLSGGLLAFARDYMGPAFAFECSYAGARKWLQSSLRAPSSSCCVPTLELATLNDGLIHPDMIQQIGDHYKASPKVVTAITAGGAHTIRWQGWLLDCWASHVALEFAEAVLRSRG